MSSTKILENDGGDGGDGGGGHKMTEGKRGVDKQPVPETKAIRVLCPMSPHHLFFSTLSPMTFKAQSCEEASSERHSKLCKARIGMHQFGILSMFFSRELTWIF
ncbi:hypothetical protein TREES_T100005303 [Tupaia chinensis]|uniref:Uncharacterized protein n=1 Tax=Tupaia chinensis TaxID=246437 RepID=L9KSM0_TUPCH|nr:hypothetical protein TREES_T100005303 [Tupaia chinensis]